MIAPTPYILGVPRPRALKETSLDILKGHGLEPSLMSLAFTKNGQARRLLGTSSKVEKGQAKGWLTKVMYFQPHLRTGYNVCGNATPACSAGCLIQNGNFLYPRVQKGTFAKTFLWLLHPQYFLERVVMEILQFSLEATMSNKHGAVRLNGTSDIKWYLYIDFAKLANDTGLRFYDYTKNPIDYRIPHPSAYSFTYSLSEHPKSWERAIEWLDKGYSAAMVVAANGSTNRKDAKLAQQYLVDKGEFTMFGRTFPTVHGDDDDLRMLDNQGSLVVLYAKNKALRDDTAFVTRISL